MSGELLSNVWVSDVPEVGGRLALRSRNANGALLGQYFGRGDRRVVALLGDFKLPCLLGTRWTGVSREWWLDCVPLESTSGATRTQGIEARGSAQGPP
ncbi:MAG: hypothetical protein H6676_00365 [Thermoflexaceae bacterium]|nr:hypothetical protein [Thermoflexaceae bacterium]